MAVIAILMCVNFAACSEDDEELDPMVDVSEDYGKITKNSFVATGGYRDVKPLTATILSSINTVYQGAYSTLGVEFTPFQPNFNTSETKFAISNSGVSNGHFTTDLISDGEGLLEPGTIYYYRAYAYVGGTKYNGEIRSFETPDFKLSDDDLVDLGLSVKWASYNMGASSSSLAGTLLQQRFAFKPFDYDESDALYDISSDETRYFVPEDVDDNNWLGNSKYDVATRTMGNKYRIPTEWEWQELEEECCWKSGEYNGTKGFYISDKVDGTSVIFLPYVKKSSKHDITVYLSASEDIIGYLKDAVDCGEQYKRNCNVGGLSDDDFREIKADFHNELVSIEKEIGVGEVLTEKAHTYCDYGLVLCPFRSDKEFDWTHPITGKKYNFYEEKEVKGGGVLYVRPVSNR